MRQGKVLFFLNLKGYGFVQDLSTKREYYFRYKVIESDEHFKKLERGDYVEYEIGDGERPEVINIRKIERKVDGKSVCRVGILFYKEKVEIAELLKVTCAPGLKYIIPCKNAILASEFDISKDIDKYMEDYKKDYLGDSDLSSIVRTNQKYDLVVLRLRGKKIGTRCRKSSQI